MATKTIRRLAGFVDLTDEDGNVKSYGPRDKVPTSVAAKITNPAAWEEVYVDDHGAIVGVVEDTGAGGLPPTGDTPQGDVIGGGTDDDEEVVTGGQTDPDSNTVEAPPRNGPGSSADAWLAFARAKGVPASELPDGTSRDDVIAYLEQARIIAPAE